MSCATFIFKSATTNVFLRIPTNVTFNDTREIKSFHFWNDSDLITDYGKESKNITITGTDYSYASMTAIDDITNSGDEITISGIGYTDFDTTWYIENFTYSVEGGVPNIVNWSITLEKSY